MPNNDLLTGQFDDADNFAGLLDKQGRLIALDSRDIMRRPAAARRNIVNEQVTFLYNGNNPNDAAKPLTGLMPVASITGGPGVVDHIKIISTASDAFRACQLVVFVDGEVTPSVNFQLSHFGLDYQSATDTTGHVWQNGKMVLQVLPVASGISQCQVKFGYEIPYTSRIDVYIFQRQPIMTWWTEVAYRAGVVRPYRLKSQSTNSNGPTFARGGTTGYAAAASTFTSPMDGATPVSLPAFAANVTPAQLSNGSVDLLTVPAGTDGAVVAFSWGAFNPSQPNFSYMEANVALYSATQKAAGLNGGRVQALYESTGTEDFFGSSFYFLEGVGSWGDYYVTDYNSASNQGGPGAANTHNIRAVLDLTQRFPNGLEFRDGAYMTFVQSSTNLVSDPGNATGNNTTGQTGIATNVSLAYLTLYYVFP